VCSCPSRAEVWRVKLVSRNLNALFSSRNAWKNTVQEFSQSMKELQGISAWSRHLVLLVRWWSSGYVGSGEEQGGS